MRSVHSFAFAIVRAASIRAQKTGTPVDHRRGAGCGDSGVIVGACRGRQGGMAAGAAGGVANGGFRQAVA